jgi:L-lactate dehydrogenase complex protein LldE
MHIGGGLSRLRAGVRTMHLAEILAATEPAAADHVHVSDVEPVR